jgi:hypothetical protein
VTQAHQSFTQEIDYLLDAAVPLWRYRDPGRGQHGDVVSLATDLRGTAIRPTFSDYHSGVPSQVAFLTNSLGMYSP